MYSHLILRRNQEAVHKEKDGNVSHSSYFREKEEVAKSSSVPPFLKSLVIPWAVECRKV